MFAVDVPVLYSEYSGPVYPQVTTSSSRVIFMPFTCSTFTSTAPCDVG